MKNEIENVQPKLNDDSDDDNCQQQQQQEQQQQQQQQQQQPEETNELTTQQQRKFLQQFKRIRQETQRIEHWLINMRHQWDDKMKRTAIVVATAFKDTLSTIPTPTPTPTPNVDQISSCINDASEDDNENSLTTNDTVTYLIPKNAICAIKDMKHLNVENYRLEINCKGCLTGIVSINGQNYIGEGYSKQEVKINTFENALRDIFIENWREHTNNTDKDTDIVLLKNCNTFPPQINQLACFAIYKLFDDWIQQECQEINKYKNKKISSSASSTSTSKKRSYDCNETVNMMMHPITLLTIKYPKLIYKDCGVYVTATGRYHKVEILLDDHIFEGMAKSKRIARRNAAANCCNILYNTNYVTE